MGLSPSPWVQIPISFGWIQILSELGSFNVKHPGRSLWFQHSPKIILFNIIISFDIVVQCSALIILFSFTYLASDLFFTKWEPIDLHCFCMWSRDNSCFWIESAIERKGIMSSLYYFSKTYAWEKGQMLLFPLKIPYKPFSIIYTHDMHWFYIESSKIDYSYRDQTLSIWEKLEIQVRTCVQGGSEENGHQKANSKCSHGPSITQQHCSSEHASLSQLYH